MVNIQEKCSKCQYINELETINPYICKSCGSLNFPKKISSRLAKNKRSFHLKIPGDQIN